MGLMGQRSILQMSSRRSIVRLSMRKKVDHLESITGESYGYVWSASQEYKEGEWSEESVSEINKMLKEVLKRLDPKNQFQPTYERRACGGDELECPVYPKCSPKSDR